MKLVSKQETNDFDDTNIKQLSNYTHDENVTLIDSKISFPVFVYNSRSL